MANEYSTLAAVKAQLSISGSAVDAQLAVTLTAASRQIDNICSRRFFADVSTSKKTYLSQGNSRDDESGSWLEVDDISTPSGLSVEVGDGIAWWTIPISSIETYPYQSPADGTPITSLILPSISWRTYRLARITAIWGWPAVPEPVIQATQMLTARIFRRKDSPEGVLGSAEWGQIRVSRIDPDIQSLLAPYTKPGFA